MLTRTIITISYWLRFVPPICHASYTEDIIDPALAKTDDAEGISWYDLQLLSVEGKGWSDTKGPYDRLPARAEGVVRDAVWSLSRHSAGISARFVTDAT